MRLDVFDHPSHVLNTEIWFMLQTNCDRNKRTVCMLKGWPCPEATGASSLHIINYDGTVRWTTFTTCYFPTEIINNRITPSLFISLSFWFIDRPDGMSQGQSTRNMMKHLFHISLPCLFPLSHLTFRFHLPLYDRCRLQGSWTKLARFETSQVAAMILLVSTQRH